MTTTELTPPGTDKKLAKLRDEDASKRAQMASSARASTDFYGAVGWLIGLFLTLIISIPIIWFLVNNASRSARSDILIWGIAIAWWLNPLSLGALGYVLSNVRAWRFKTVLGLLLWATVNFLVSAAIVSTPARIIIINGLVILGYILLGLLFLY